MNQHDIDIQNAWTNTMCKKHNMTCSVGTIWATSVPSAAGADAAGTSLDFLSFLGRFFGIFGGSSQQFLRMSKASSMVHPKTSCTAPGIGGFPPFNCGTHCGWQALGRATTNLRGSKTAETHLAKHSQHLQKTGNLLKSAGTKIPGLSRVFPGISRVFPGKFPG